MCRQEYLLLLNLHGTPFCSHFTFTLTDPQLHVAASFHAAHLASCFHKHQSYWFGQALNPFECGRTTPACTRHHSFILYTLTLNWKDYIASKHHTFTELESTKSGSTLPVNHCASIKSVFIVCSDYSYI
jgi:hypothetical protein